MKANDFPINANESHRDIQKADFRNTTKYNRSLHDENNTYSCIANSLTNNDNLNAIEKGLMLMILSNSDEYIFNSTFLFKRSGLSRRLYFDSIDNLILLGYIQKYKIASGWNWIINETPIQITIDQKNIQLAKIEAKTAKKKEYNISKISTGVNVTIGNVANENLTNQQSIIEAKTAKKNENNEAKISTGVNVNGSNVTSQNVNGVNVNGSNVTSQNVNGSNVTSGSLISTNETIENKINNGVTNIEKINIDETNTNPTNINQTSEILIFGFSEVSFTSVQLKNFNKIFNFFKKEFNISIEEFKKIVIAYCKHYNLTIQDLPIELNSTSIVLGEKLTDYHNDVIGGKIFSIDTNIPTVKSNTLNPIIEGKNEVLNSNTIESIKPSSVKSNIDTKINLKEYSFRIIRLRDEYLNLLIQFYLYLNKTYSTSLIEFELLIIQFRLSNPDLSSDNLKDLSIDQKNYINGYLRDIIAISEVNSQLYDNFKTSIMEVLKNN